MDASSVAAAALAVVIDESREAAVRDLLLERERLATSVADHDSTWRRGAIYVVFARLLLPRRLMSWQGLRPASQQLSG